MLSGVLYVELIGPESQLMERKLVYIQAGTGEGFFDIMQDYPQGPYLLRAYTEWNRNLESDCIFREHILIFTSIGKNQTTVLDKTAETDNNNKRDHTDKKGNLTNAEKNTNRTETRSEGN